MKARIIYTAIIAIISTSLYCQDEMEYDSSDENILDRVELDMFGSVLYQNFNWSSDPELKSRVDLNHFVLAPEFEISEKFELEMEIEFEHGGTGSTLEIEDGDSELEIEQGGEVLLEELELEWHALPWLEVKAGKIRVPIGLNNIYYHPSDYMTSTFNSVESAVLPLGWYQIGVGFESEFGKEEQFEANFVFVNGLDNSRFDREHWFRESASQPTEFMNAESFAFAGRLDYNFSEDFAVGFSGYAGNTTPNRMVDNLDQSAWLKIADIHLHLDGDNFYAQALGIRGVLDNADSVFGANAELSDESIETIPSKISGAYAELGYDMLSLMSSSDETELFLYGGYYYLQPSFQFDNSEITYGSLEWSEIRGGINFMWNRKLGVKADYAVRTMRDPALGNDGTFTIGMTLDL